LDLFRQRIGGKAVNLTESAADDSEPAFSPDGNFIAFRSERDGGGLFLMGATGESVRRLTDTGYDPAWSPDGKEIVYATAAGDDPRDWGTHSQLWRIEVANPSRRHLVTDVDGVQPSWSPGGQRVAFWSVPTGGGQRTLWTVPVSGGKPVRVTDDTSYNWSPAWSPDGRYLYFASDRKGSMNLWRIPIDEDTGNVQGPPEPVTSSSQWNGPLRLSRDGRRIAYAARDERSNLEKAAFDPAGPSVMQTPEPINQSSQAVSLGGVSPDGRWIVFRSTAPQEDLFLVRPDGTGLLQLTRDEAKDRGPVWMPDGRILFFSDRSKSWEAWTIRPDGSELRQLTDSRGDGIYRPLVSPDGRWLVCVSDLAGTVRIDLSRPPGQRAPEPLSSSPGVVSFYPNSWSLDGRRLLGTGTIAAGFGIFSYTPATHSFEKLADRGQYPVWMRDGRRLLYLDQGKIRLLDSQTKESRDVLAPPPGSTFSGLDLSPDERTLYLGRTTPEGDIWMLSTPEDAH
jgi:Tol biopolymer transport system component